MVVSVDVNEATHNLHPPGCAETDVGDIPVGGGGDLSVCVMVAAYICVHVSMCAIVSTCVCVCVCICECMFVSLYFLLSAHSRPYAHTRKTYLHTPHTKI